MRREVVAFIIIVTQAWMAAAGLATGVAGEAADGTARAAGTSPIALVDALETADVDTSRAVVDMTRDAAVMNANGLILAHVHATGIGMPNERAAEVQARTKAALLKGEIQGAVLPLTSMLRQSALFGADQIPLLVVDEASSERLIEALAPRIDDRLAEHGLALLGLLPLRPVGLTGGPSRGASGSPRTLAVSDAGGRRLAELVGARTIDTPADEIQALISKATVDAGLTSVPDLDIFDPGRPPPLRHAHGLRLLCMTGWPLAMIVVRRELVAERPPAVRNRFWQEAARHADTVRKRWRRSITRAHWPRSTGLMGQPDVSKTEVGKASADVEAAASSTYGRAQSVRVGPADPTLSEAVTRLRAAALTMAVEWAIGAGADGLALLQHLGVPPTVIPASRPAALREPGATRR